MGRPRPGTAEPTGPDSGGGGGETPLNSTMGSSSSSSSPPPPPPPLYPPAVPYPPPPPSRPPPPVVAGTPVSFPPTGSHAHAVMPPHGKGGASPYPADIGGPWSTGIFDCEQNQTNAIMTAFFPCVTFGQIAEILDEGETSCTMGSFMYIVMVPAVLSCWILGSKYRQKLRRKYNLVQAPSEDWTLHLFCSCCALCQEFRELEKRGINPSLGWMGYLAQQQGTWTAPPENQFMGR